MQFSCQVRELTFHVLRFRSCSLKFTIGDKKSMLLVFSMLFSDNMDA